MTPSRMSGSVWYRGDDYGLAGGRLDDVGEGEGAGGAGLLEGFGGRSLESFVELLGEAGAGGALEKEVGPSGGRGPEVGADGVGKGALDGVGESEGAVGFGLQEGVEAGVLVEEEGEHGDGQQNGRGGNGGQDGDLAGQGAGPATAGSGWGALLHGAGMRGRVD